MYRIRLAAFAAAAVLLPATHAASAQDAPASPAAPPIQDLDNVQVVAKRLDTARQNLAPDLGADAYRFSRDNIAQLPGGSNTPLNDVLLQAPGVVQDSYGQLHIRGDHANVQYRINDIIIPESIGGFGQSLQTRFADNVDLITGALPAQYGYRTAGVVKIDTKGGGLDQGGVIGITGGSHDTRQLYGDLGGSSDDLTYFVTGSLTRDGLGIEAPTSNGNPLHDDTRQSNTFGYFSYHLSNSARLSLITGAATNKFQIPDIPGQQPLFPLNGAPDKSSSDLDQNQTERTNFTALALQGSLDDRTDYQLAIFHRYTGVDYLPDAVGDLQYTGVAGNIRRGNDAYGIQSDASYALDARHTLRAGLYVSRERFSTDNASQVFAADANGNQTSATPLAIVDDTAGTGWMFGVYAQDAWKVADGVTINYGLRFDNVESFVHESRWSPRLGVVWQASASTTLHAGYARYFTPPPSELVTSATLGRFDGTTNAPLSSVNDPVSSERSHYFDAGVSQKVTSALTLGVDVYYRKVDNLLDEGQFGSAILFTPFNYAHGKVYGVEFAASYHTGDFSSYANLAISRAQGRDIVSSQYVFDADELAYIRDHWIDLDHNQTYSASAGAAYLWRGATLSATSLYASGLRAGFANSESLPSHVQVDAGVARPFDVRSIGKVNIRLTIANLFDRSYEIRDGSGVGVGAPQFGPRRGYYLAIEKPFTL
ncbi:MAG: TonB-dependent receptor [Casimicrobiaceae bacterium]